MQQNATSLRIAYICLALHLYLTSTAAALGGDSLYYIAGGQQINLAVNDSLVVATDPQGRSHAEVVSALQAEGFEGYTDTAPIRFGTRHIFSWAPTGPSQGDPPPDLTQLVNDYVATPENDLYLSPVLTIDDPQVMETGAAMIIEPRIQVRFMDGTAPDLPAMVFASIPGQIDTAGWLNDPNIYIYEVDTKSALDVLSYANILAENEDVDWANPHFLIDGEPSEGGACSPVTLDPAPGANPNLDESWNLPMIGAENAWAQCGGLPKDGGDPNVVVVIHDDGIDPLHPDINQLPGYNFAPYDGCDHNCAEPGGQPRDECDNHGTVVAGFAGGVINNNLGSTGIAPGVQVISLRTFYYGIEGCNAYYPGFGVDIGVICEALSFVGNDLREIYADDLGPDTRIVSNMSWNWTSSGIECMRFQIGFNRAAGMLTTASVGNSKGGFVNPPVRYPATIPDVLAVFATDETDGIPDFSRYDEHAEIGAPGDNVFSTDRLGSQGYFPGDYAPGICGTSYAAPTVAGAAALILSEDPSLSVDEVEARLCRTADPIPEDVYGCGRLNVGQSLAELFLDGFESGDLSRWSDTN